MFKIYFQEIIDPPVRLNVNEIALHTRNREELYIDYYS